MLEIVPGILHPEKEYELTKILYESLKLYVEHGIRPGSFLQAVLENDLEGACNRADMQNRKILWTIVNYIYNEIPWGAWHSSMAVNEWIASRGFDGMREAAEKKVREHETDDRPDPEKVPGDRTPGTE